MVPVHAHTTIAASREEVFDFVNDLANRAAWMDHFTSGLRLAHPKSDGVGAAARYQLGAPRYKPWIQTQIVESERPRRVLERTTGGHGNRTEGEIAFDISRQGQSLTRVELTIWSEAGTARERFLEKLGARRWVRRQAKIALERLRTVFEEERDEPLARATVAGWEPQKAPRFGLGLAGQPDVHTGSGQRASSG
jgi:carbon monoxide dehydrogenase subunit G